MICYSTGSFFPRGLAVDHPIRFRIAVAWAFLFAVTQLAGCVVNWGTITEDTDPSRIRTIANDRVRTNVPWEQTLEDASRLIDWRRTVDAASYIGEPVLLHDPEARAMLLPLDNRYWELYYEVGTGKLHWAELTVNATGAWDVVLHEESNTVINERLRASALETPPPPLSSHPLYMPSPFARMHDPWSEFDPRGVRAYLDIWQSLTPDQDGRAEFRAHRHPVGYSDRYLRVWLFSPGESVARDVSVQLDASIDPQLRSLPSTSNEPVVDVNPLGSFRPTEAGAYRPLAQDAEPRYVPDVHFMYEIAIIIPPHRGATVTIQLGDIDEARTRRASEPQDP